VRKVHEELRERIRALAGMDDLLPALNGLPPVYLVGGAVRDLLLGQPVVDVDLAVEGDGPRTARELASRLDGDASPHERFGTATVRAGTLEFDIAATRSETYPDPLARVWSALNAPHAGDFLLSLAEGYEAVDWGGVTHAGGGSHGSLHAGDSLGPLLFVGCGPSDAGDGRQWALRDVAPVVFDHFGLT